MASNENQITESAVGRALRLIAEGVDEDWAVIEAGHFFNASSECVRAGVQAARLKPGERRQ